MTVDYLDTKDTLEKMIDNLDEIDALAEDMALAELTTDSTRKGKIKLHVFEAYKRLKYDHEVKNLLRYMITSYNCEIGRIKDYLLEVENKK